MRAVRINNATRIFVLVIFAGTLLVLDNGLASAPNPVPLASDGSIARIRNVQINGKNTDDVSKDQAAVIRANNGAVQAAQKGVALYANDQIQTGSNAQIFLDIDKASAHGLFLIKGNSRVKLEPDSIYVHVGKIFSRVKGLFSVKAQDYMMAPLGTEFEVEVRPDGVGKLIVLDGQVQVQKQNPVVGTPKQEIVWFGPNGSQALPGRSFLTARQTRQILPDAGSADDLLVNRLQEAVLPVDTPLSQPNPVTEQRVREILNWTSELIIASQPSDPVGSIIPTFLSAEQRNAEFRSARYKAIWKQETGSHEKLGSIFNDWGEGLQAVEEFRREQTINPDRIYSQTFLTGLAEALRLAGELKAATDGANQVLKMDNCWAPAKNSRGNIEVDEAAIASRQGDNEKYKKHLEDSVKEYQEAFAAFILREDQKDPRIRLIEAVAKVNEAKAYFALGDLAEEQGKHAEAAEKFDAAKRAFEAAKGLAPDYLAKSARNIVSQRCDRVQSMADCHARFPTGCSRSGAYDAFLNFLKNRPQDDANPRPLRELTQSDFRALEAGTPEGLARSNHADYADALANLGEGGIYSMVGYLISAKLEGPETANCQLRSPGSTDYQLQISFRAVAPGDRLSGSPIRSQQLRQQSIVVEVTPHFRARYHPNWTAATFRQLLGRQVLVIGQLILDNHKLTPNDNCGNAQANRDRCWRASAWELHPVMQLYVCESASPCLGNSPNWKRID